MRTIGLMAGAALMTMASGVFAQGMTEPQARSVLGTKCPAGASTLSRDSAGNWHGYCSGNPMMVDTQGNAGPDKSGSTGGVSEPQARSALATKCPAGASTLNADSQGNWHGYCSGNAMMVDSKGNVAPDKPGSANGLTEANARAIAWDNCTNPSSLSQDGQGNWLGYCSKGAIKIDPAGKFSTR